MLLESQSAPYIDESRKANLVKLRKWCAGKSTTLKTYYFHSWVRLKCLTENPMDDGVTASSAPSITSNALI